MRTIVLLIACAAALLGQARKSASPKAHLAVDATVECASCHDKAAEAWDKSKHGVALMKCAGCHGWPGEKFTAKPASTTCRSCHPAQFEEAKAACTSCHAAHALTARHGKQQGGHR